MYYRDTDGTLKKVSAINGLSAFESAQIGGFKGTETDFYDKLGKLLGVDDVKDIVTNSIGYVTYKMFGAKLDGVTDDSEAVKKAHEFANEHNIPVCETRGKLLCNFTVDVKTSCNLDLEFVITDTSPDVIYNVVHDNVTQVTETVLYEKGQKSTDNTDLFGKYYVLDVQESEYYLGRRKSTIVDDTIYYHKQPIAVDMTGNYLTSPIFATLSDKERTYSCSDISERPITITGGFVNYKATNLGFKRLFFIKRNNVTLTNFTVKSDMNSLDEDHVNVSGLISISNCCNIKITNITAENHSTHSNKSFSYVIDIFNAWNVTIRDSVLFNGWGATATHWCDNLNVENCVFNRIDSHYGIFGSYNITNCTMVQNCIISAGYGDADIIIRDTNIITGTKANNDNNATWVPIVIRDDFNVQFCGHLKFDNVTVESQNLRLISIIGNTESTSNISLQPSTMSISIANSRLKLEKICNVEDYTTNDKIQIVISNCEILKSLEIRDGFEQFFNMILYNSIIDSLLCNSDIEMHDCTIKKYNTNANSEKQKLFHCMIYGFFQPKKANAKCFAIGCVFEKGTYNALTDTTIVNCYSETPIKIEGATIHNSVNITA